MGAAMLLYGKYFHSAPEHSAYSLVAQDLGSLELTLMVNPDLIEEASECPQGVEAPSARRVPAKKSGAYELRCALHNANSSAEPCQETGRKFISMKCSSFSTAGAGCLSMQESRSQDMNKQGLHTPQTKRNQPLESSV
ncbi:Hypothetical predicted protein [Marmota monax]|uniref:Uncharacterized protein n=1 Tax=Marmota monax TaxID=9995 RepID=A0A5E4CFX2_MARMO|nr:hypothetical protein GHT09_017259 [Marmota monax]VTJ80787.1 Hypothetical predicted protein [Marmota monax]